MAVPHEQAYLEGVRLFNAGEYWHAHEQWEACWLARTAPHEDDFFKGIIQTAAALVHWQRGNPRGIQRNWTKSRARLTRLPAQVYGLNIADLIATMDRFAAQWEQGAPAPTLTVTLPQADT